VSIPTAVSYALANQMLAGSLVVLVLVALAVLLAAQLYAHKLFLNPVTALADAAQQLAKGDLSARTGLAGGQGELSELARTFDEMAVKLQQRQAEVESANREIRTINAELEARVRDRTAQLESANRELEAFSYSTSHDLRAPLRHIGGFAKMLQTRSNDRLDEEGRRYLAVIADSSKKMGCLIDDLLVFSRMGRQAMSRTTVKMDTLVREVVAEVAAENKGRAIDWVISPLPDVHADSGLLRQVWLNLVRNAVKYSQPRERVHVEIGVSLGGGRRACVSRARPGRGL
jgi:signal transduction histidine kinase